MTQRGKTRRPDSPKNSQWRMALASNNGELINQLLGKLIRRIEKKLGICRGALISRVENTADPKLADPEEDSDDTFVAKDRIVVTSVNLEAGERAVAKVTEVIAEILKGTRQMPSENVEGYLFRTACTEISEYSRTDMPEDKGDSFLHKDEGGKSEDESDKTNTGFRAFTPTEKKSKESGPVCASCGRRVDANGNCQNPQCGNCRNYNPKNHGPPEKAVEDNRKHHKATKPYYDSSQMGQLKLRFQALWEANGVTHEVLQELAKEGSLKIEGMTAVAGEVMTLYLWGYRPVDIVKELSMSSEESISNIKREWFKHWHWDDNYQEKVRICLLCQNLVDVASKVRVRIKTQTSLPRRERSSEWLRLKPLPESEFSLGISLTDQYWNRKPGDFFPPEDSYDWTKKTFGFREDPPDFDFLSGRPLYQKGPREIAYWSALYEVVVTDLRTKAWFGKLPKDEEQALARFVDYLRHWGWGSNPRKKKRGDSDELDFFGDRDDDSPYEYKRIEDIA